MINVQLSDEEKAELTKMRNQTLKEVSEKALMVLLSGEGKSVKAISEQLKRHPHTVRYWLKRFNDKRMNGLNRCYSPGRPNQRQSQLIPVLTEWLQSDPSVYGFAEKEWTVNLLIEQYARRTGNRVSEDTVQRALKDADYSYRRSSKGVSSHAPSREEKQRRVLEIIDEIRAFVAEGQAEIFALDESYFSTEPYISRSWQKKKWPPEDLRTQPARKLHDIWRVEFGQTAVLLETVQER